MLSIRGASRTGIENKAAQAALVYRTWLVLTLAFIVSPSYDYEHFIGYIVFKAGSWECGGLRHIVKLL